MKIGRKNIRFMAIIMALCFLAGLPASFSMPAGASAAGFSAAEMAGKAVDFINQKYKDGEKIDGYTACALSMAGEDLTAAKWNNGNNLKKEIQDLADLLGDGNSLITYICSTQNSDGSFGPYANQFGTKAPLQALAMVKGDLAAGGDDYNRVQSAVAKAVNYFKAGYQNGGMTYSVSGMNFDYRCVEALAGAGEDLSVGGWVYQGTSLRESVIASAYSAAADPSVVDAVYLAKELAALYAVNPDSAGVDTLAGAIAAKQAADGSFGGSIYDHVMVLTALGRSGRIGLIDQTGAFNYINGLKRTHKNSWGQDTGVAWGSEWTKGFEEPDTTAQVITALSYLAGAADPDSDVYKDIQGGLAYLADIQDADTAAIPAQWDSTFATAETLIALKSLGKGYDDYAGAASGWVKKSKTKTVAQCLLALNRWNDTDRRDRLANLLAGRQRTSGQGTGSFENSVYSDMWAFIALGEAGKTGLLNTDDARSYILSKQGADCSWGESFGGVYYPDVMSTTQAIRALSHLTGDGADQQVQEAVTNGLAYLKGLQQADGGVYSTWDDPAVDNSELIVTLHRLGKDPAAADWRNNKGLTPVDYLLNGTMNADGSFGTSKNVLSAAEALYALLLTGGQGSPGGGGSISQEKDSCSVDIAVVGQNGELLYGPGSVTVSKTGKWGLTALGALHATGLLYTESGGFVSSIAGQANSGMKGWMYKVNGTVPSMVASAKTVNEGDRVIWWYSSDMNSSGPEWEDLVKGNAGINTVQTAGATPAGLTELNKALPASLQLPEDALTALEKIVQSTGQDVLQVNPTMFAEGHRPVTVVGSIRQGDSAAYAALKNNLDQNVVDLVQKVTAGKEAIITGGQDEAALIIPAGALSRDVVVAVREAAAGNSPESGQLPSAPEGFHRLTSIFDLGPDGTEFAEPVTIVLKVAIPPLIDPEKIVFACYDKSSGRWVAVPAVVDADRGVILAGVLHFSQYAVLAGETVKSFADVTVDNCGWAKNAIELLAGAGIVSGVDGTRFEPDRPVTRAEFASLLARALGIRMDDAVACPFKDVQAGRWYAGAVSAVYNAGLIKGDGDGSFRPESAITREEVAAVLSRAMKLQSPEQKMTFKDAGLISAWAREGVAASVCRGLIKGFPDGTFRPGDTASRAQCAVMVRQMLADYWGGE
ncbi:MAG: S-layer homology domain-containing protein [Bacillota bacterium]